ncbi:MAG: hypothetical protein SWH61_04190 [Thermodesulfobacteriota bacterium]|nr:hypothetical protein [Thermodesulfobacteriota bacterium]
MGTGPASGYVLYGEHLLDRMNQRLYTGASGFMVEQSISAQSGSCEMILAPDPEAALNNPIHGNAWFGTDGAFRMEVQTGSSRNIYVTQDKEALTIIDGAIRGTRENPLLHYKTPLLCQDHSQLSNRLTDMGINTTISSLGRTSDNQVAYVIGARFPDASVSQLWVDKTTFLPIRLLLISSQNMGSAAPAANTKLQNPVESIDIHYENWARQNGIRYPMRIVIFENSRLVRVICAAGVERKDSFPDNFFDIRTLKTRYPVAEALEGTEATALPGDTDDVHQTIEDFKKLYQ